MTLSTWLIFVSVSLAAAFTPGPAVLMAISNAGTHGPGRALYGSAGNVIGLFIVAAVAISGLGLMLETSTTAFSLVKVAGAIYLIYIGIRMWRRSANNTGSLDMASTTGAPFQASRWKIFRAGVLMAVSNPKGILFFTAVFPQFVPPDHVDVFRFFLLTSVFAVCTFLSHVVYVLGTSVMKSHVRYTVKQSCVAKRGTAVLFMAMGGALLRCK